MRSLFPAPCLRRVFGHRRLGLTSIVGITARMEQHHHHSRSRKFGFATLVTLVPSCCIAHGQQVLVLPFSNGVAVIGFLIFISLWRERVALKLCAFALLCLGVALSWNLPLLPHTVAELAGCSFSFIFLIGFGIPAAMTVFGYILIRLFRKAHKPDA
ncbi:MAG: hypothetical protein C5B50_15800 [Verrucomicrobia bacterium]|nr:MAG: hypothetical protein C5B50_15800 [Verrucomicrobiota bacterium]